MITLREFIKLIYRESSIRVLIKRQYSDAQVYYFAAEGTIENIFYDINKFITRMGNPLLESIADNEVIQVEACNDGALHTVSTFDGRLKAVTNILTIVVSENKPQGDNNERNRSS